MNDYKASLESEKASLVAQLQTIATLNTTTGDWVALPEKLSGESDENIAADTVEDWNERRALLAQLETRHQNIKIALQKFDNNTFGKCEVCDEEIEIDRLEANPAARTCKIHLEKERELPF